MDPEVIKSLASQGVFAALFGYLGHRQLKQSDRLQEQNEKMILQLIDLTRAAAEREKAASDRERASLEMMMKMATVLDKVSARLEKVA